jgi:aspartyl-tRNA(Asn)/glutamyl-tRNA(Gln) amidotransferase subunit C
MPVSERDVERVAELANLELTPGEKSRMLRDLNSILEYVAQLNQLDTASIPPMAQVGAELEEWEASNSASATPTTAPPTELRVDEVSPSLERDVVLDCAPDTDHIFFRVPKVIER